MTEYQKSVLRCAIADLTGAWQDYHYRMKGSPFSFHDWSAHEQTIVELAETFDLTDELPEDFKGADK